MNPPRHSSALLVRDGQRGVVERFGGEQGLLDRLEVLLRSLGTTHLVLTGIATSGVVLSTLREAADRDYELTVLRDGCADADDEVHRVLIEKLFPRQAEVLSVAQWIGRLHGPASA